MKLLAAICFAALIVTGCKKDTPAFKPEGFWRGNAYLYHAAILNRSNGTSRLYFVIPGTDTSKAGTKIEGTHIMSQGKFIATFTDPTDTLTLESTEVSAKALTGLILSTTLGQAVPFNFKKQ